MIGFMSKLAVATAFAAQYAHGHAVLLDPAPFNVPATKTGPCGINLAASQNVNVYSLAVKPGATVSTTIYIFLFC
jgi:hypothetical protein